MISLCSTMRFSSFTTRAPTHTEDRQGQDGVTQPGVVSRTLFADERVVPVVGVVRITESSMGVLKLEEFVAVLPRMAGTARVSSRHECRVAGHKNKKCTY